VRILLISLLALAVPGFLRAQSIAPLLVGTWVLESDATTARARRPITGISVATRLVIREAAGEITMETNTGSNNTTVTTAYKPGGAEHSIPGPIGWETRARSEWAGDKLVITIKRSVHGPEGELVFDIVETYTPARDTLLLERSMGRTTQKLTYKRAE
jgi:hypothetical protein